MLPEVLDPEPQMETLDHERKLKQRKREPDRTLLFAVQLRKPILMVKTLLDHISKYVNANDECN